MQKSEFSSFKTEFYNVIHHTRSFEEDVLSLIEEYKGKLSEIGDDVVVEQYREDVIRDFAIFTSRAACIKRKLGQLHLQVKQTMSAFCRNSPIAQEMEQSVYLLYDIWYDTKKDFSKCLDQAMDKWDQNIKKNCDRE